MVTRSFDIALGTRVQPSSERIAEALANRKYFSRELGKNIINENKFLPQSGEVVGHAGRGGDFVLVRWDGDPSSDNATVHWANLRPEGGDPFCSEIEH